MTDGKQKVSVLVYIHKGAFSIRLVTLPLYHNYVSEVATKAKEICLSVEYRKLPEHHLPAAYDHYFGVLEWLDHQAVVLDGVSLDLSLASCADFRKVFMVGDSVGGNIVHQLQILMSGRKWDGLCFQGVILVHLRFHGKELVGHKVRLPVEAEGFKELLDALWRIILTCIILPPKGG